MKKDKLNSADRLSPGSYVVVVLYVLMVAAAMYLYQRPPGFSAALTQGIAEQLPWLGGLRRNVFTSDANQRFAFILGIAYWPMLVLGVVFVALEGGKRGQIYGASVECLVALVLLTVVAALHYLCYWEAPTWSWRRASSFGHALVATAGPFFIGMTLAGAFVRMRVFFKLSGNRS